MGVFQQLLKICKINQDKELLKCQGQKVVQRRDREERKP